MAAHLSAREVIDELVDAGTFVAWDVPVRVGEVDDTYREQLARAEARTGCDEAVLTGQACIGGHTVALIVSEFGFMGGSVGTRAAARIVAAVRRATEEEIPIIGAPASGGTRMQDGAAAFAAMVDIATAIRAHALVGLPYLVYLRDPTTGGTLASWGTLGHLTLAEPGAFIGFLGPSVVRALTGGAITEGVQRSENLLGHAQLDLVVNLEQCRHILAHTLDLILVPRRDGEHPMLSAVDARLPNSNWDAVEASRSVREDVNDIISREGSIHLRGTGEGRRALVIAITRLDGQACLVIAHDRQAEHRGRRLDPQGLRDAQRAIRIAEELRLPIVTMIDTAGAALTDEAESGGLAAEIAECAATLGGASVPSVSVLIGEGAGGGAMALFPAARRLALPASWFSPLPPEGASQLLHGSPAHASDVAETQRIGSRCLLDDGVIHEVVPDSRHIPSAVAAALRAQEVHV